MSEHSISEEKLAAIAALVATKLPVLLRDFYTQELFLGPEYQEFLDGASAERLAEPFLKAVGGMGAMELPRRVAIARELITLLKKATVSNGDPITKRLVAGLVAWSESTA